MRGRGAVASWPQAASMSRPRVRRTVAGTRARSSTALNRSIASPPPAAPRTDPALSSRRAPSRAPRAHPPAPRHRRVRGLAPRAAACHVLTGRVVHAVDQHAREIGSVGHLWTLRETPASPAAASGRRHPAQRHPLGRSAEGSAIRPYRGAVGSPSCSGSPRLLRPTIGD
jgi:hypothetical protein